MTKQVILPLGADTKKVLNSSFNHTFTKFPAGTFTTGTEQQLWQRTSSLPGNHDQRVRVEKDAQR